MSIHSVTLIFASAIWGFTFVAQRVGMEYMGPFYFNGFRFTLGAVALSPLLLWKNESRSKFPKGHIWVTLSAGSVLFIAISLQQIGLIYTTAGKAGFLTSFYMILVPLLGYFLKHKISPYVWIGILTSFGGLYFLNGKGYSNFSGGDSLILLSALFWAMHILIIGRYSAQIPLFLFAILQYSICAGMSFAVAIFFEPISWDILRHSSTALIYAGLLSTAIAFTLQIIALRHVPAANAVIIFSTESLFALLGGWWLLDESVTWNALIGGLLILWGILISQFGEIQKWKRNKKKVLQDLPT